MLLVGPALLRLRFGVDEVVTTLLLNFIVILFVGLMVEGPLKDPMAFGWPQSVPVAAGLRLPDLVPRSRLHVGPAGGLLAVAVVWVVQMRTVFGAETRAAGLNPRAAAFAGVPLGRTLMLVALPVRRPCGPCRGDRGAGADRLCHHQPVARLRLCRHRRRHAGRAASRWAWSPPPSSSPPSSSAPTR